MTVFKGNSGNIMDVFSEQTCSRLRKCSKRAFSPVEIQIIKYQLRRPEISVSGRRTQFVAKSVVGIAAFYIIVCRSKCGKGGKAVKNRCNLFSHLRKQIERERYI